MFAAVVGLVDKLKLDIKFTDEVLKTAAALTSLRKCSNDLHSAIRHISLSIGETAAMDLNARVANGEPIPTEWEKDPYLCSLSVESKLLRWMACTSLPHEYTKNCDDETCLWPEHKTFHPNRSTSPLNSD